MVIGFIPRRTVGRKSLFYNFIFSFKRMIEPLSKAVLKQDIFSKLHNYNQTILKPLNPGQAGPKLG